MSFDPTFLTDFLETPETFTHPHVFCAYCGQKSTNSGDCFLGLCFSLCGQGSLLRITWAYTSLNIFCHLWCFRSMRRRLKLNLLFQCEKLSVISVLLLLGSSSILYILVPRRQDAYRICGTYNKPIFLSTVFQRLLLMLVWFSRILSSILSNKYVHISSWHLSLKYWKEHCLSSLRGITVASIHFELPAHFSPVSFICCCLFFLCIFKDIRFILLLFHMLVFLCLFLQFISSTDCQCITWFFDLAAPVPAALCPVSFFLPSITPLIPAWH